MPSASRVAATDRRWKERQAREVAERENRRVLERLRADVRAARLHRDDALEKVRGYCRSLRASTVASHASCAEFAAEQAKDWAPELDRSLAKLAAERKHQAEVRDIERRNKARGRAAPKASRAERRSESDDEVRANLPPDLVPLFNKVRRSIKATPYKTRTEAFLEYAEEHPEDVLDVEAIEDETERMIREHEEALRSGRRSPCGPELTELGRLTAITWTTGERRWPLSKAPLLAYCPKGRLFIVYRAKPARKATATERREYARTHWGQNGRGMVEVGELPKGGTVRELGPGVSITYTTRKGSDELVDWIHEWGEGGRGRFVPPTVVEHVCQNRKCAAHGTIRLRGGTYRVTERGIVG